MVPTLETFDSSCVGGQVAMEHPVADSSAVISMSRACATPTRTVVPATRRFLECASFGARDLERYPVMCKG